MSGGRDDNLYADHAADRLMAAIERAGSPVCVGIDPVADRLPTALRPAGRSPERAVEAIVTFTLVVLDAVAEWVPCVKFQSACFERYRSLGFEALCRLMGEARQRGLQVILDAKRGDIGISAEHYAAAAFDPWHGGGEEARPDWITVNSYLGEDGIKPFLREGFGAFALVRTSNPGSDAVQAKRLAGGQTVAESVAGMVASLGRASVAQCGYSALGAVVAATKPEDAAALRALMPQQILLVAGFGVQGGRAEDIRPCFAGDGRGAIVTASRSVIYAFDPDAARWTDAVADATKAFAQQIGRAVGMR